MSEKIENDKVSIRKNSKDKISLDRESLEKLSQNVRINNNNSKTSKRISLICFKFFCISGVNRRSG